MVIGELITRVATCPLSQVSPTELQPNKILLFAFITNADLGWYSQSFNRGLTVENHLEAGSKVQLLICRRWDPSPNDKTLSFTPQSQLVLGVRNASISLAPCVSTRGQDGGEFQTETLRDDAIWEGDDSDRWHVLKHPIRSPVLIHVHCAFRRIGTIPAGQCDPHASRVATKWLQEHSSDFRHFHWPPKSPEMNIIEDIRDALLHAVEKRSPPPRTPMDLLTALQDSWCEFPPGYLQAPVEFMPRRFASLLRARGGPTRY
ncbi:hypothetical protein AVEN_77389-1 [Araneus ventricosus]|uniref:Tc1-like transposase DDE domain-containing protein n=1 Tax=Araneus ventricosus TaxID=182803 RepID=A0A4Y2C9Z4_ARAVE|nr:hypothetical protein AVEN_77389-1 [Araneus ventricosus]